METLAATLELHFIVQFSVAEEKSDTSNNIIFISSLFRRAYSIFHFIEMNGIVCCLHMFVQQRQRQQH